MKHPFNDMIDMERFLKMEVDKYEREIFSKLPKCTLNLFYVIDKFKYDAKRFTRALKKRKILFRDIEFSEDNKRFRLVEPREMTLDESLDKTLEFARNMVFVHQLHDSLEVNIKNDPIIQAAIEKGREKYKKKY